MTNPEESAELLDDLLHDLGKYIAFPIQMLPVEATDGEFRDALNNAIYDTRTGPNGSQSAREIWQEFLNEGGNELSRVPGWDILQEAVERALAWGRQLQEDTQPIHRAQATADLRAISPAIRDFRGKICD